MVIVYQSWEGILINAITNEKLKVKSWFLNKKKKYRNIKT